MIIRAVVFDLDQTLYDRDETDRKAMRTYYREHRDFFRPETTLEEATRALIKGDHEGGHFGWTEIVRVMRAENVFANAPSATEICHDFQALFASHGTLYPYTIKVLEELKAMGLLTGLITNGNEVYQWGKIRGLGIEGCFDSILVGSVPETAKPHKEIFLEMARRLRQVPEEMLYVGDHPANDIDGSRKAGYTPVWVETMPWDFPEIEKPLHQIKNVSFLPSLIRELQNVG
jgi:putative hydrolase of the HAD superfamily